MTVLGYVVVARRKGDEVWEKYTSDLMPEEEAEELATQERDFDARYGLDFEHAVAEVRLVSAS